MKELFKGRELLIATMHGKERIIGPLLEKKLGVKVVIPQDFNSDIFGTFSGETERKQSQPETARLKAKAAREATGIDLVLASEGAFQPHHLMFMAIADYELLLLHDERHKAEWQSWEVSLQTQAVSLSFKSPSEALKHCRPLKFPSHAAIIKVHHPTGGYLYMAKGIQQQDELIKAAEEALKLSPDGTAIIENDLRAHFNPTRQKVIKTATKRLIGNLNADCPQCLWPGFIAEEKIPGLPCSLCGSATRLTQFELYRCARCNHKEKRNRLDGQLMADPKDCDNCNP